jgi:hypothetical protein
MPLDDLIVLKAQLALYFLPCMRFPCTPSTPCQLAPPCFQCKDLMGNEATSNIRSPS